MKDVGFYFTFAEVVRTGSFTAAARALGVTKATVSKQVMHLENTLVLSQAADWSGQSTGSMA